MAIILVLLHFPFNIPSPIISGGMGVLPDSVTQDLLPEGVNPYQSCFFQFKLQQHVHSWSQWVKGVPTGAQRSPECSTYSFLSHC